jgi:molybdopterin molybdotransferase
MAELTPSPLATGDELPVETARAAIAAAIKPITETETIALTQAVGRVLAADVISPIDVPAHDNSAMDGYALHGADLAAEGPTTLTAMPETVYAGAPFAGTVGRGQCIKIMTGAVMPQGLDSVVPRELVSVQGDQVILRAGAIKPGKTVASKVKTWHTASPPCAPAACCAQRMSACWRAWALPRPP